MDYNEIYSKLKSSNIAVLKQSISFINEKNSMLIDRAKQAESRATAVLTVSGILTGFLVYFSDRLYCYKTDENILISICYIISILFLTKAVFYAIRVFWIQKRKELTPDLIFDIQSLDEIGALKEELRWKIWWYEQIKPFSNLKLFRLNRALKNIVLAIIVLMIFGFFIFLRINIDVNLSILSRSIIIALIAILILLFDFIPEKMGSIWNNEK